MEKKFTLYSRTVACTILTLTALILNSFTVKTYAQSTDSTYFLETFGTGTIATSNPDVITSGLTYQDTGSLIGEGRYRVINNTHQKPEWQMSEDHTSNDVNGDMLVINGQDETFYGHRIDVPNGFKPGATYHVSLYLMNVDPSGLCGPTALLPKIRFDVQYLSSDGTTWVPLNGSPFTADSVVQTSPSSPTWVELGGTAHGLFLPSFTSLGFTVTSIRIVLTDGTVGGCGNDFALDDLKFSWCTDCSIVPVTFLGINARQKGSGVSVEWSTAQEFNSSRFDIEKSADGNSNWSVVASVNGAGNSSNVKKYNAYDPQPFNGINFYRIKQVDIDGHYMYSNTVNLKLNFNKTGVSVLINPFHNSLTVDFSSSTNQVVSARLADITGKQVVAEKWSINTGSTRKDFSNVSGLQPGMYILTVSSSTGEILYNNKVIKQ